MLTQALRAPSVTDVQPPIYPNLTAPFNPYPTFGSQQMFGQPPPSINTGLIRPGMPTPLAYYTDSMTGTLTPLHTVEQLGEYYRYCLQS